MSNRGNNPSRGPAGDRGRGRGRGGGPQPTSGARGFDRGGGPRGAPRGAFDRGRGGGGALRGGGPPQIFAANTPARPDDRLSTADELVSAFKKLEVRNEEPFRPGWGTKGTPIVLRSNFFPVRMPKGKIYDYNVSISPKADLRGPRKARIFELLEQSPPFHAHVDYIAHDRSQRLVSARQLPQPLDIPIILIEEGQSTPSPNAPVYNVTITFERDLETSELTNYMSGRPEHCDTEIVPLVSALNLVLQQHASRNGVRVGQNRYFFPFSTQSFQLGLGIEAFKGFFISVRPMYKQLMVNVNVCMTAFYRPGNLADAMVAFSENSSGGMPNVFADRLKIVTTHLGYARKRTVTRIMRHTTARRQSFSCQELGGKVTVEEYFTRKYNIQLRYADTLPVVDVGTREKPNYLPAEICEIPPGQAYRGTLSDTETANMIRFACNPPNVNATSILQEGFPLLGLQANAAGGPLNGFGIAVSDQMTVVPARVLLPPRVTYRSGQPNVRDGSWNILGVKFQSGGNMQNWAVLVVRDGRQGEFSGPDDPELQSLLRGFADKCKSSGMSVPDGPPKLIAVRLPPPNNDPSRVQAIEMIRQTFVKSLDPKRKPSFVLVLLSGVDKWIYPGIKQMCDVKLGLHTVHMLLSKARIQQKQDQYFSNVALKVNVKLGGINHKLDPSYMKWLTIKTTMLVGIDVTHPGPKSMKGTPSIAAVVASVDDNFVHFPASLQLQRNRNINKDAEEMTQGLQEMMVERLVLYEKRNKRLPERVIVFRDGVSEGQYKLVNEKELPQILGAFKKFNTQARAGSNKGDYRPALTIIICGKRHHGRFLPTDVQQMSRSGNPQPGTVVDKGVTDIYRHDFYLQAHNGLQGQARPTHYTIVYDENRLSADVIQEGTNASSYLYARATKAVSLIPPAYYADLACERARFYLNSFLNMADDKSISSKRSKADEDAEKERNFQAAVKAWGTGVHEALKESMFYI